jgi:hypothetical protein
MSFPYLLDSQGTSLHNSHVILQHPVYQAGYQSTKDPVKKPVLELLHQPVCWFRYDTRFPAVVYVIFKVSVHLDLK